MAVIKLPLLGFQTGTYRSPLHGARHRHMEPGIRELAYFSQSGVQCGSSIADSGVLSGFHEYSTTFISEGLGDSLLNLVIHENKTQKV